MFTCPQAVTHPSTNPTRHRVTSLIKSNALPLSHATQLCKKTKNSSSKIYTRQV